MIHRETVGLDLGSHSAKVVRAMRIGGRLIVRDAAWVHLPPNPLERSRILAAFPDKRRSAKTRRTGPGPVVRCGPEWSA